MIIFYIFQPIFFQKEKLLYCKKSFLEKEQAFFKNVLFLGKKGIRKRSKKWLIKKILYIFLLKYILGNTKEDDLFCIKKFWNAKMFFRYESNLFGGRKEEEEALLREFFFPLYSYISEKFGCKFLNIFFI